MGPHGLPQVCHKCRKLKVPQNGFFVKVPGRCHDQRFICFNCHTRINKPEARGRSGRSSPIEKEVRTALITTGYRFESEYKVGPFWVDFVIPALRLAIEAQGLTFHRGRQRKARDKAKKAALEKLGWAVTYVHFPDAEGQTRAAVSRREGMLTDRAPDIGCP